MGHQKWEESKESDHWDIKGPKILIDSVLAIAGGGGSLVARSMHWGQGCLVGQ